MAGRKKKTKIEGGEPLIFGLKDPGDNEAQRGFLHSFRYRNNYIAGRGSGKTVVAVAKTAIYASMFPHTTSYITEQTGPMIADILVPAFRTIVPNDLYSMRFRSANSVDINWRNGHTTRLRSRQAKNSAEDPPFRGPDAGMITHDEAALDRSGKKMVEISEAMLRGNDVLCLDCISTPKLGWLYDYCQRFGIIGDESEIVSPDGRAVAFYGKTKDNAYNNDLDGRLRESYSEHFASQELDAQWVALSGRIWNTWEEQKYWPAGNLHWAKWLPGRPYTLSVDLGVRSAWLVWQKVEGADRNGTRVQSKPVDVCVAEYTPQHGNSRDMIKLINERHGRPACVDVGNDINTRAITDGQKPMMFFSQTWPGIHVRTPSHHFKDKEIQHWAAQSAICNSFGQRTICVSEHLMSDDESSGRGFMDMIHVDAWPEGIARSGQFFEKDKATGGPGIEDVRDAFLYHVICSYPPEMRKDRRDR